MFEIGRLARWGLCFAFMWAPLGAVEISSAVGMGSPEVTLEAGLDSSIFEADRSSNTFDRLEDRTVAELLGGTLILQGGVLVPSKERPVSALEGNEFGAADCENCANVMPATENATGARRRFRLPLIGVSVLALAGICALLFFFISDLRAVATENVYVRQRWGVKARIR